MLTIIELMMWTVVAFVLASIFLGLPVARRLGLPKIAGQTWRVDLRGWPGRWAWYVAIFLGVEGLICWLHSSHGFSLWPGWKKDLVLYVVSTGLITPFTLEKPRTEKETDSSI